jgi:hypothetical protein
VKTVLAWVVALLVIVGIGVSVEAAVGVGAAPALGTVTGVFEANGGPALTPRQLEGGIYLYPVTSCTPVGYLVVCRGRPVASNAVEHGRFSISAPGGKYDLVARSPRTLGSQMLPNSYKAVVVVPGATIRADIVIAID